MRGGHRAENEELGELPLARLYQRLSLNLLCASRLAAADFTVDFGDKQ